MRILVLALTVTASITWSWWSTRFTFDAASHIRSAALSLLLALAFCANIFVPIVAVSLAAGPVFGTAAPATQIVTLALGAVPMLVFSARHVKRWRPSVDDRSSKA